MLNENVLCAVMMDTNLRARQKENDYFFEYLFYTIAISFDEIPFVYRDVIQKCTWINRLDFMHKKTAHAVVAVVAS